MWNVEIFVKTKFSGRLSNGMGVYAIAVRLAGRPETAKYTVEGWKELSYQKLSTRAAVAAITRMVAPAHIKIVIDSTYAFAMMNKGHAGGCAHEKLWQQYFDVADQMESVEVIRETEHEYTEELTKRINSGIYITETDKEE